jgi:hypothetical protein
MRTVGSDTDTRKAVVANTRVRTSTWGCFQVDVDKGAPVDLSAERAFTTRSITADAKADA